MDSAKGRAGFYVELPDSDLRWRMRRAAADARLTLRELTIRILRSWLSTQGYDSQLGDRDL